ncbi:putative Fe-S cluster assembly protein SufT [Psychromonas sp. MB-3u-54]|uniref:putative Fe-S cluster assembly protein SufT n=1 Tax=Psychromonas sp. MB-3u-54 TaxID=2058319 RepID=UPI000C34C726|nr:putative Fe-S cluster assembly protein SufT [Psychromonas sp. MB-3u-54]PKH02665.1 putative Fe-S cluster assembly protein SufT [Psychromonas sp. MB-3u-54]
MFEQVTVLRDCKAITIPNGGMITLKKGDQVVITQALGGSYTVNYHGQLLRVTSEDADALGKPALTAVSEQNTIDHEVNFVQLYDQLKSCYDPEIPVNIVELGLIYDVNCYQLIDGRNLVRIIMTLTAAGCAMGTVIADEVKRKCLALANVDQVEVVIVFDPPWSYEMVSDAAKLQLGLL